MSEGSNDKPDGQWNKAADETRARRPTAWDRGLSRLVDYALGIAIGIAISYFSDYLYLKMRQEGLTPRLPFTQTTAAGEDRVTDIFLVPFDGFAEPSAHLLANALERDTGLNVTAIGAVPLPLELLDRTRNQYDAGRLAPLVQSYTARLRTPYRKQLVIAILKQDMYSSNANWNFALSANFDDGVSIVATERLVPYNPGDVIASTNRVEAERIFGERVYKMLKRTIGLQFYGYERKAERKSVLASPVMSVLDVDEMGLSF